MATKDFDFVLTFKKNNTAAADVFGSLLSFLPLVYFLRLYMEQAQPVFIISSILIAFLLGFNYFKKRKGNTISFRYVFLIIAITFIIIRVEYNTTWLAIMYFILLFVEMQFKRNKEKGFDKDGITDNGLMRTFVPWQVIKNVLIKDGILTIDYKNNKLFQMEIEGDIEDNSVQEFNTFCEAQLLNINASSTHE